MGKHARTRSQHSHRKPSTPKRAAAVTGAAAVGTMTAGAIIVAGTSHAAVLPDPKTVADVIPVQSPQLHVIQVRQDLPETVTVASGDTLSAIAKEDCGAEQDWTGTWKKNEKIIGPDWNLIVPGQVLALDCKVASLPVVVTSYVRHTVASYRAASHAYRAASTDVNPGDYSGFQECVVTRESGGRAQVMNSSGHYGLYQFDEPTWEDGGGSSADFGRASVSEQNRVFANVYAKRGVNPWRAYDGC